MATLYKFLVTSKGLTQKQQGLLGGLANPESPKGYSGSQHGVDHNRYMRAVNPLINKIVGGSTYEKSIRGGRAVLGIASEYKTGGVKGAITSVGAIVLVQMAIMAVYNEIKKEQKEAKEENNANFMKLMTGQSSLSANYSVSQNIITNKVTFKNQ